uniref:Acid phosphatase n=1 Tax=Caenorhabditis japonica TaxID=281687 RepID=A0A8R1DHX0_CAEJA
MVNTLSLISLFGLAGLANAYFNGTKELIFVQTLWRHGDRSPTRTFKSDPFQESSWQFGGGGWGQLSPEGMLQHFKLGGLIHKKYVDDYKFFPDRYDSKKIYVRSTDVNRTIISAQSNLLGQYSQSKNSIKNVDYPDYPGWPTGFVPIAVHTVADNTDHIGNVEADCPLREQVWNLAKTSDEVKNFVNSEQVSTLLANLTTFCGETIDIDNLWIVTNALFIEQIYYNETLRKNNYWFSDELYNLADAINDRVQLFENGIFNTSKNIVNNHDVGLLTRKLRGGSMLNDMVMHMNIKLDCANKTTANCTWINNLKNYIYSAHDTTIYAFFSALLIEKYAVKPAGGYPLYSAAVFVELYVDRADNDKPYFKMLYHEKDGAGFQPVTQGIQGCPQDSDFCDLDVLRQWSSDLQPDQPIEQWCYTDLNANNSSSTTPSSVTSTPITSTTNVVVDRYSIFPLLVLLAVCQLF